MKPMPRALLIVSLALLAGCAELKLAGSGTPAADVCILEGAGRNPLQAVDGAPPKARGGLLAEEGLAELAPGRHTTLWTAHEAVSISFVCSAGHRYRLKAGEVEDARYGSRKVFMIEDVETKEVLAAQR
ncbi:MAG: hypothetical protein WC969_11025 [Elusimicrobiota bacterium]|jgi:hypothetical protein